MEPKCEVCGARHNPHQAHRWPQGEVVMRFQDELAKAEPVKLAQVEFKEAVVRQGVKPVGVSKGARGKFDRLKYQREYMRKWRARRKVSHGTGA